MAKKKQKNELILPAHTSDTPSQHVFPAEPAEPEITSDTSSSGLLLVNELEWVSIDQKFDNWFSTIQPVLRLNPDLKASIKAHFKRYGFWDNAQFDKGLEHFGIKLNLF